MGLAVAGIAILAAAWQLYSSAVAPAAGRRAAFPSLVDTLDALGGLVVDPSFWPYVGYTMRAWAIALVISVAIAVPLGLWLGLSPAAYRFFRLPLELIRPIPAVVILPLVIVLLGTGLNFQVVLIMQGVVWPVLIQTAYGVHLTHRTLLETARSFGIGRWRVIAFFRFPAAAPLIATSLKIGATVAFAIAVTTEYIGGSFGIGSMLREATVNENIPAAYAITMFTGIAGVVIVLVFAGIERYFARWAPGGES
ncbi:ABC transporter permease subunit [Microbacterium sp. HD4P20]|uniref:ABC transporter permease n=1 Tax=Microbacterium sp. HD4P20 TaxID=2864874 RepID=UPI0020A2515E|nr:ABC transporter permease subunit [Microbacterium sp. HD4P20]MCP2636054.1 ABC transporter permease subunit [Microbacterium sp. HD4P20]